MAKVPKKQISNNFTLIPTDYQPVVISSLKRSFSRGPIVRNFLKQNRREEDWVKKDGSKAKKKHVFYTCAECKKEFNSTQVQVDHINPVVPLNIPAKHMSMSDFIQRLYVEECDLQILCKLHHKLKSKAENTIRQEWVTKTKYIVYQTVNRKNHKSYIGVHKCEDYDDGYLGSGTLLKKAIEKYGPESFYRYVLYAYETAVEAYAKEQELVNSDWINNNDNYNVNIGGIGNIVENTSNQYKKRVVCHQTGQVFSSVGEAAESLNISQSSLSKGLNNPQLPIRDKHFFTVDKYDPNISVTFPIDENCRKIVHLNKKYTYASIKDAADKLGLNYRSLRNALLVKTRDNVYALEDQYFLYDFEYDPSNPIEISSRKILCVELNRVFDSLKEAATFIKHKKPAFAAILIGRSARDGKKAYKFHWKYIEKKLILS